MTSLADTPEDRASGLIWHGRYSEARELVEKMPEDSIRGHVINMYIAASIAIATGTVETYDAWKVSVNKVLEVCAGDGVVGAALGWVGGKRVAFVRDRELVGNGQRTHTAHTQHTQQAQSHKCHSTVLP